MGKVVTVLVCAVSRNEETTTKSKRRDSRSGALVKK